MIDYNESYINDVKQTSNNISKKDFLEKSFFITGATGLVCSPIIDVLHMLNCTYDSGIKIYAAGRSLERTKERFYYLKEGTDYHFVPFTAEKYNEIEVEADYYIHGASKADPTSIINNPIEVIQSNITGSKAILDTIAKQGHGRFLYISSSEVYGKKEDAARPFEENDYGFIDILNPRSCYPNSKRLAETLAISYIKEKAVDAVIARPGHVYGPTISDSDSRATAQFTRNAKRNEDIVMKSAGTQLRSYCYILDCASALLHILLHGVCGNAYNISNPESVVSIARVADAIADASGNKVMRKESTESEINSYNMMDNSSLDSRKLMNTGWKPRFSLEEGINATLASYTER